MVRMKVPYSYLKEEFHLESPLVKDIMRDIADVVAAGDFTLGKKVTEFEEAWAQTVGTRHAVGVSNGTDAIFLILRAIGVTPDDIVVTVPNTFLATVGAILQAGAQVDFVDIGDDYNAGFFDSYKRTVFLPVHWGGCPLSWFPPSSDCPAHRVSNTEVWCIVEDACQAIGARSGERNAGAMGHAAAFSLHPLKNVNIWGDGGVVTTDDPSLAAEVRLLRNHGLEGRNTWLKPGYNMRLSTVQAVVGLHTLKYLEWITERRIENAKHYDEGLKPLSGSVLLPKRHPQARHVYHLYQFEIRADKEKRDLLIRWLNDQGVEAKMHYPMPLHFQPPLAGLGYKKGDFPRTERFCDTHVSLPVHQYLTTEQIDYTIEKIGEFCRRNA